MASAVLSQGVKLGHGVQVNTVGRRVVPPVARLDDAALLEKRQCDGNLRERHGFALDECLKRDARLTSLTHRVTHVLAPFT